MADDKGNGWLHDTRIVVASVLLAATWVICAVWVLVQTEPTPSLRNFAAVAAAVIVTAAILVGALRSHRKLAAVPAIVGLAILVAVTSSATSLHWRWSREDFAQVIAGRNVHCGTARTCSLGWWRTTGTTRLRSFVVVWLPTHDCDGGHGLAHPIGRDPGIELLEARVVAADLSGDLVSVDRGRDGWYSLCFVT